MYLFITWKTRAVFRWPAGLILTFLQYDCFWKKIIHFFGKRFLIDVTDDDDYIILTTSCNFENYCCLLNTKICQWGSILKSSSHLYKSLRVLKNDIIIIYLIWAILLVGNQKILTFTTYTFRNFRWRCPCWLQ